tara:strand:+ start:1836 stop:2099 length:264 start_codon:yes stop_codon:yes gene_type:complete
VTKIYTYCLFNEEDVFYGVYSSLKAIHRDALKLCNKGTSSVVMESAEGFEAPSLTKLRNMLKGQCDVVVRYKSSVSSAKILKTKLKE